MPQTTAPQSYKPAINLSQSIGVSNQTLDIPSNRVDLERVARKFMHIWILKAKLRGVEKSQMEPAFGSSSFYLCHSLENLYYNLNYTGSFRGKSLILEGDICITHMDDTKGMMLLMYRDETTQEVKYSELTSTFEQFNRSISGLRVRMNASA